MDLFTVLILGSALLGGFIVVSSFSKTKDSSDEMLTAYSDLLTRARDSDDDEKDSGKSSPGTRRRGTG